ncbi:MAG: hypothetical protein KAR45_09120, partial [Desulfobacteraceae bacterium]|nr:hypothetical protein [Desulfobacteraceae bacterium]
MKKFPLLEIPAKISFLPVAVSFVENTCLGSGFGKKETTALVLATEEIFVYLNKYNHGTIISICCKSKKYLMELSLKFDSKNFNPRAFNLTTNVDVEDEASLDEMGLLIAGRMVDGFTMEEEAETISITLQKYRMYEQTSVPKYSPESLAAWSVASPDRMETKILTELMHQSGKEKDFPFYFQSSGMIADMKEVFDLNVLIIKDHKNTIAGGLFWQEQSEQTIEMFGPYVYGQTDSEKMGCDLIDKCLEVIGKEKYKGLLCRYYGDFFPETYFEIVGNLSGKNIYFRELHEDPGSYSWIHPRLKDYIANECTKLFLPRNIMTIDDDYEAFKLFSVISSKLNRSSGSVTMCPFIIGKD